jgi:hypothetical protein
LEFYLSVLISAERWNCIHRDACLSKHISKACLPCRGCAKFEAEIL